MAPLQINWPGMFTPDTSPLEMVLRGTVMYFVLLALLRLVPRRTVGSIGIMDLLVVLVAEAAGKRWATTTPSVTASSSWPRR